MLFKDLHLFTDHLHESRDFYCGTLGFELLEENEESFTIRAGKTKITWNRSVNEHPQYHFAFNIPFDATEDALEWIQNKARLIPASDHVIAEFPNWNARAVYFFDNNENIVELIGRKDLDVLPDREFSASSIIALGEMGIVTDDVNAACRSFISSYGIDYFSRQPPFPDFAALGDDQGLLIVVSDKRNWYPTTIPSNKCRMIIHFENNDQEYMIREDLKEKG